MKIRKRIICRAPELVWWGRESGTNRHLNSAGTGPPRRRTNNVSKPGAVHVPVDSPDERTAPPTWDCSGGFYSCSQVGESENYSN